MMKAVHSSLLTPAVFEFTSTGIIDDLDFNNADLLKLTNSSGVSIRGIKAGFPGQILPIIYTPTTGGSGFVNQDTNSAAANRLINISANRTTIGPNGHITYQYDSITQRWREIGHEQGSFIGFATNWTGSVSNPSLGNGTLTEVYVTRGKFLDIHLNLVIGSTTTLGSGVWLFSLPNDFSGTYAPVGSGFATSGGGATSYAAVCSVTTFYHAAGDLFGILAATGTNISNAAPVGVTTGDILRFSIQGVPIG